MPKKKVTLNRPRFSFTPPPEKPKAKPQPRKRKPVKKKASKPRVPKPDPEDEKYEIGDPAAVTTREHATKTATKAIRKNRAECLKKGVNAKGTNPLRPVTIDFVPDEEQPDFVPGLNDITIHTISNLVRNGIYQEYASEVCGIPSGTMCAWLGRGRKRRTEIEDWVKRAEELIAGGATDEALAEEIGECPDTTSQVRFVNIIDKAKAEAHNTLFGQVWQSAQAGDVETSKWLLERMYPHLYGKYAQRLALKAANGELEESDGIDPVKELQRRVTEVIERARSKSSA